jgi:hypothetical protein
MPRLWLPEQHHPRSRSVDQRGETAPDTTCPSSLLPRRSLGSYHQLNSHRNPHTMPPNPKARITALSEQLAKPLNPADLGSFEGVPNIPTIARDTVGP